MGCYCFNKLPFGISSALEDFQCSMSEILVGLEGVLCEMDDDIIFGRDQTEHDQRLEAALTHIEKAGVTLNPHKCEFSKSKLTFLGHVNDGNGIRADTEKTKADEPTNQWDASAFGIGAVLLQKSDSTWKSVAFAC